MEYTVVSQSGRSLFKKILSFRANARSSSGFNDLGCSRIEKSLCIFSKQVAVSSVIVLTDADRLLTESSERQ